MESSQSNSSDVITHIKLNDKVKVDDKEVEVSKDDLIYGVDDIPPMSMCLLLSLQQYLIAFTGIISHPLLLLPVLCVRQDDPGRGSIMATCFFVSGLSTLLQTTFGCRLPIVQGGSFAFLIPAFAILNLPHYRCPVGWDSPDSQVQATVCLNDNATAWEDSGNSIEGCTQELWQVRMREIQGSICVAAIFQIIIGYSGLIGLLLKYITPLTIGPAVAMIGLPLFDFAAEYSSKNWSIAILTIVMMTLFSQYLRDVSIPCISYSNGQFRRTPIQMFKLFPIIMALLVMWGFCALLTVSGSLGENNAARTDLKMGLIHRAAWFRVPYPFQWGFPTVSAAGVLGMLAGIIASAIESVGDYCACARLSGVPPPPTHAINRGIGTEGLGLLLSGIWGTGNGTTSFSTNIAAVGLTKVASRRVIQWSAIFMIIFGLLNKFNSFFLTIPDPIIGGIFCILFGMIAAVGLSSLQFVDLNSTRNLFILGFSMFFSLVITRWIKGHQDELKLTGMGELDQIIKVLLSTSMFVAGALGFILDNTIPGSYSGELCQVHNEELKKASSDCSSYNLPLGMNYLRHQSWARYLPFLPMSNQIEQADQHSRDVLNS